MFLIGSTQPRGNRWGWSITRMYYRAWSWRFSSASPSTAAVWGDVGPHSMTQISTLCPRVVWEPDGVQWATEWKTWRMAQRDGVGEEPGETVESGGGKLALPADEMSEWGRSWRCAQGMEWLERSHTGEPPTPPPPLLPALETASMTTKTFLWFFCDNGWVSCILQQLFRCYLW